ncbi:MAG: 3'-5' exonuclease [Elusimicrobia bacterium]|nr:3'-5' exonuclease [Elusimicrobiota bacterium]
MSVLLRKSLHQVTFSFLDVETTGLSPWMGGRVCELAVLKVKGNKEIDHFHTLVHPGLPIPLEVQRIHGISDAMVASSPRFEEISSPLISFLEGTVVVCHNAPFDIAFLNHEFGRSGISSWQGPVVDTLALARRHFKFPKNNLGFIAQSLDIVPEGWHRALNDVKILKQIFDRFLKEFSQDGVQTLQELLSL